MRAPRTIARARGEWPRWIALEKPRGGWTGRRTAWQDDRPRRYRQDVIQFYDPRYDFARIIYIKALRKLAESRTQSPSSYLLSSTSLLPPGPPDLFCFLRIHGTISLSLFIRAHPLAIVLFPGVFCSPSWQVVDGLTRNYLSIPSPEFPREELPPSWRRRETREEHLFHYISTTWEHPYRCTAETDEQYISAFRVIFLEDRSICREKRNFIRPSIFNHSFHEIPLPRRGYHDLPDTMYNLAPSLRL